MVKVTHNNHPAEKAKHWNEETKQLLGTAIYYLCQCKPEDWRRGWSIYYDELYNWFFPDEWNEYIGKLDEYRKSLGYGPVKELLEDIGIRMEKAGGFKKCPPRENPIPVIAKIVPQVQVKEITEQVNFLDALF